MVERRPVAGIKGTGMCRLDRDTESGRGFDVSNRLWACMKEVAIGDQQLQLNAEEHMDGSE